jgi:23S rRNA pseudouridine2605 synthase
VRRYRVRVFGAVDTGRLMALSKGITIEGITYGAIEVDIERAQGANTWLSVALTEGKNREIRRVMEHLGLAVNRLIRVAYGPFDLGGLEPGDVAPVPRHELQAALEGKPIERAPRKPAAKPQPRRNASGSKPDAKPARPKPGRPDPAGDRPGGGPRRHADRRR